MGSIDNEQMKTESVSAGEDELSGQEKPDIFDKIMHLPALNLLEPFYKQHKEGLLYLFFGGLAFLLSVCLFWVFHVLLSVNELIANVFTWVICVCFAYMTNRTWVFRAKTNGFGAFVKQMGGFFAGRLFTLVVEELIIFVFITQLAFNSMVVKILAQVVVIVLNYVISKLLIFKKTSTKAVTHL